MTLSQASRENIYGSAPGPFPRPEAEIKKLDCEEKKYCPKKFQGGKWGKTPIFDQKTLYYGDFNSNYWNL